MKGTLPRRLARAAISAVLALTSVFAWAGTIGPDAAGYRATDAAVFSFVDIAGPGGGASILAGTDDGTAALTLPFSFTFYGQARTLACVSSNGALYFINNLAECSGFNDFANTDLSSTATPGDRPALLPFWTDLTFDAPGADAVAYQTLGLPGARRFVIQWNKAYPQGSANPVTFQIVLTEGTDKVVFQYKTVALGPGNPASLGAQATIGIRDASGQTTDRQIGWSYNAPVLIDDGVLAFTTIVVASPTVTTTAATAIGQTGATLNGTVNPNGTSAAAVFDYGLTTTYGTQAPATPAPGSGSSAQSVSSAITGLTCATTYHFRLVATNGGGTTNGSDQTFATATCPVPSVPPTVSSPTASGISATAATLGGNATADGGSPITQRGVVYSVTATNGNPLIGGAGVTTSAVGGATGLFTTGITGLAPGTNYSFKAFATNAVGTNYASSTFTTLLLPTASTGLAGTISGTSATLTGTVNPNGNSVTASFDYGPTTSYGSTAMALPAVGSSTSPVGVSAVVTGLSCGTTYHFRVKVSGSAGTTGGSDATFVTAACGLINSFTASPVLVNSLGASTLSWSVASGSFLTLNGAPVYALPGSMIVNPATTTSYTLVATYGSASNSRTVTVNVSDGAAGLGTPSVTSPASGQTVVVTGIGFTWTAVGGASGYDIRVLDGSSGSVLFSGSLLGEASTSTLISLPAGIYQFAVRACAGGFTASQCGAYGTVSFTVSPAGPTGAPTVTFPTEGANLTSSTQTLSWTAVPPNPVLSDLTYEVLLRDLTAGSTALQITVPSPNLSTIFTMKSLTQYELKVRACQAGCGPYSTPVTFAVALPPVPTGAPTGASCSVSGGNSLTCNWNAVTNADAYQVQVVQAPPAGPGGGALTSAAKQVSATTVTLSVPAGAATVFIAACNGDGCGPNTTVGITAAGPNSSVANIGTPMAGTVVSGPGVLFTWNRVPGDNGSNTSYRLFVQDLSRQSTALDVFTTNNFYSAYFKAEGARYDALVVSNPGLSNQANGPSQGFNVAGASATAPTMVSPAHNSTVSSGNIQLGWSPVPGATLYEYFVAVLGQGSASARGVTPGLLTQVPLTGSGAGTVFSGIVRACPSGAVCASGSDVGWGPWSNAPGGPGVTNFTVVP